MYSFFETKRSNNIHAINIGDNSWDPVWDSQWALPDYAHLNLAIQDFTAFPYLSYSKLNLQNIISQNTGNTYQTGTPGDDIFTDSNLITTIDNYDGGAGNDTLIYTNSISTPVTYDLTTGQQVSNGVVYDTFVNIENLQVAGAANLAGNDDDNILTISAGNFRNVLSGGGGNDTLNGNGGADVLYGGDGNDTLYGDDGNDTLYGGEGDDTLDGGSGADQLYGDYGNDTLYGGEGDDTLDGGWGEDQLYGGDGNDSLRGDSSFNDALYGGDGDDTFTGVYNHNIIDGGAGFDVITLNIWRDNIFDFSNITNIERITSRFGDDIIDASSYTTNIEIIGGFGDDQLTGGSGNDTLTTGDGNSLLSGLGGNDILKSGSKNDILIGGTGNDTLTGQHGIDYLEGGEGNDVLNGGSGADIFAFGLNSGQDIIQDISQVSDRIHFYGIPSVTRFDQLSISDNADGDAVIAFGASGATITLIGVDASHVTSGVFSFSTDTPLRLGNENDNVLIGGDADNIISGYGGNDTLSGLTGDDILRGGHGDDSLAGGTGNDELYGEDGDDILTGGIGDDKLYGGDGDDILIGGAGADVLNGGKGRWDYDIASYADATTGVTIIGTNLSGDALGDTFINIEQITGSNFADTIRTTSRITTLYGGGGDDELIGLNQRDILYGEDGNDILRGGGGNDTLNGGDGNNQLFGGEGNDSFLVELGTNYINGGNGTDNVRYTNAASGVIIDFSTGVHGGAATGDTLVSIEVFYLSGFDDVFTGSNDINQTETIYGYRGDDLFYSSLGGDRFDGGNTDYSDPGLDSVSYVNADAGVVLNVALGGTGGAAQGDSYYDIEQIFGSNFADEMRTGGSSQTVLYGGEGDDILRGNVNSEILHGGADNDRLFGGAGDDQLFGDSGNDFIRGGTGNDVLDGGIGIDIAFFSGTRAEYTIINNGGGTFTIIHNSAGGEGTDTLIDIEEIQFSDVEFTLLDPNIAPEVNTVEPDTLTYTEHAGAQIISNTLVLSDADNTNLLGASISITGGFDAANDVLSFVDANGITASYDASSGVLTLTGLASVAAYQAALRSVTYLNQFTNLSDATRTISFSVTDGSDVSNIVTRDISFAIDETITGTSNNDALSGGFGDDVIDGGSGIDYVTYSGASINDYTITPNADGSFTVVHDGGGADGTDTLSNVEFIVVGGVEYILSPTPTDLTTSDDVYTGTAGNDAVSGLDGDDMFTGLGGNDYIQGGTGADTLNGGAGNDVLFGDAGNDIIFGGHGNDALIGGAGNDTLAGASGADILRGGLGDDFLRGQGGDDVLNGGAGADRLVGASGNDLLFGGDGNDELFGVQSNDELHGGAGDDNLVGGGGSDILFGDNGNDTLNGGGANDVIYGGRGDDTLIGGSGSDLLEGGSGADTLNGVGAADTINGGAGNDIINAGGGNDIVNGGADDDTIDGRGGSDIIHGGSGNDIVDGGSANDVLFGDAGNDTLIGGGGRDSLNGSTGNDTLDGGGGADRLIGGAGDDIMTGGRFGDSFFFADDFGNDIITDFENNLDIIDLSAHSSLNTLAAVLAVSNQVGADVVISLNATNTITLQNFTLADLDAADFNFVPSAEEIVEGKAVIAEDLSSADKPVVSDDIGTTEKPIVSDDDGFVFVEKALVSDIGDYVLGDTGITPQDLLAEYLAQAPQDWHIYLNAEGILEIGPDADASPYDTLDFYNFV